MSLPGKVFTVLLEQNRRNTASWSNSSSNVQNSYLPLVQPHFNTLIHAQFADQPSLSPVDTSSLQYLHQFCPVYTIKYVLPVYETSTQFFIYVNLFLYYFSASQLYPPLLFLFQIQSHLFQVRPQFYFQQFAQILGILNDNFKPTLVQKFQGKKKAYNALATPILLYGSEIWTLRQKDKKLEVILTVHRR